MNKIKYKHNKENSHVSLSNLNYKDVKLFKNILDKSKKNIIEIAKNEKQGKDAEKKLKNLIKLLNKPSFKEKIIKTEIKNFDYTNFDYTKKVIGVIEETPVLKDILGHKRSDKNKDEQQTKKLQKLFQKIWDYVEDRIDIPAPHSRDSGPLGKRMAETKAEESKQMFQNQNTEGFKIIRKRAEKSNNKNAATEEYFSQNEAFKVAKVVKVVIVMKDGVAQANQNLDAKNNNSDNSHNNNLHISNADFSDPLDREQKYSKERILTEKGYAPLKDQIWGRNNNYKHRNSNDGSADSFNIIKGLGSKTD